MLSGWLKFAGVLALFLAVGAYFGVPWQICAGVGVGIGAAVSALDWYQKKGRIYTQKDLSNRPFNGKLPQGIGMATTTAVALAGDNNYSQRVIGANGFSANFQDLLQYSQSTDGEALEVQSALVVEPANPNSTHAVAVTCGGVVLGYIPEFESESLYTFLMQHRGMARVNSNIHFDILGGNSRVELDLIRPYRVVPGA